MDGLYDEADAVGAQARQMVEDPPRGSIWVGGRLARPRRGSDGGSFPPRSYDHVRRDVRRLFGMPSAEISVRRNGLLYEGAVDTGRSLAFYVLGPRDGFVARPVDPVDETSARARHQQILDDEAQIGLERRRRRSSR